MDVAYKLIFLYWISFKTLSFHTLRALTLELCIINCRIIGLPRANMLRLSSFVSLLSDSYVD